MFAVQYHYSSIASGSTLCGSLADALTFIDRYLWQGCEPDELPLFASIRNEMDDKCIYVPLFFE